MSRGVGRQVPAAAARPELASLFQETVGLYFCLTRAATAIYGRGPLSGPRRTILTALARSGPESVARLAASRALPRQRLQPLVNSLISEGLLERQRNPFHERSDLIGLTERGEAVVHDIVATEGRLRRLLPLTISRRALLAASGVLRRVSAVLEDPATLETLKTKGLAGRRKPRSLAR